MRSGISRSAINLRTNSPAKLRPPKSWPDSPPLRQCREAQQKAATALKSAGLDAAQLGETADEFERVVSALRFLSLACDDPFLTLPHHLRSFPPPPARRWTSSRTTSQQRRLL